MLRVGLTGNIASGKSTVARVWRGLGATVVDADELARRAVLPGTAAHTAIAETWPDVIEPEGTLDRAALRALVFADPDARARLETIVHPAVAALRDEEYAAAALRGERVVVGEIPLLFEVGMAGDFDVVVLVDAPEEVRLMRLVGERGLDADEARRMISAQMPAELKRAGADLVIENSGTVGDLERRAAEVWHAVRERAETAAAPGG